MRSAVADPILRGRDSAAASSSAAGVVSGTLRYRLSCPLLCPYTISPEPALGHHQTTAPGAAVPPHRPVPVAYFHPFHRRHVGIPQLDRTAGVILQLIPMVPAPPPLCNTRHHHRCRRSHLLRGHPDPAGAATPISKHRLHFTQDTRKTAKNVRSTRTNPGRGADRIGHNIRSRTESWPHRLRLRQVTCPAPTQ